MEYDLKGTIRKRRIYLLYIADPVLKSQEFLAFTYRTQAEEAKSRLVSKTYKHSPPIMKVFEISFYEDEGIYGDPPDARYHRRNIN